MKSLVLLLLLSPFSAHAASFDCLSYSKKLEVSIETNSRGALLSVGRSSDLSPYGLTAGEVIQLASVKGGAPSWLKFQGRSVRRQEVNLSFLAAHLTGPAKSLRASLFTSSDWTDSVEVSQQLDCERK